MTNAQKEGIYLGIDTATPYLSLSLWHSEKGDLASSSDFIERDHAKRIIPSLEALFQEAGVSKTELAGIGVGVGPGSYTGLRIGIATAKGLATALEIPLRGTDTLSAIAYGQLAEGQKAAIALDARRGHIYVGVFEKRESAIHTELVPTKYLMEDFTNLYSGLELIQDEAPDSSYLAQQSYVFGENDIKAIYL